MKKTNKANAYEIDVKQVIMESPALFGNVGRSTIISEKLFAKLNLRMDLAIFTEYAGLIGIEIKTEHDSFARLNKQLRGYRRTCEHVYVVVPDEMYVKTAQFLRTNGHNSVGIITFLSDGETLYPCAMKESYIDYEVFSPEWLLHVLWSSELQLMRQRLCGSQYRYPSKKQVMIGQIITQVGRLQAQQEAINVFLDQKSDPDKPLTYYNFQVRNDEEV